MTLGEPLLATADKSHYEPTTVECAVGPIPEIRPVDLEEQIMLDPALTSKKGNKRQRELSKKLKRLALKPQTQVHLTEVFSTGIINEAIETISTSANAFVLEEAPIRKGHTVVLGILY